MRTRTHPELHRFGDAKVYQRAYWQKRGRENIAAGLTWNGQPRKRALRSDLAQVHGQPRHVRTNQQRAERFMAHGLTWRGTPRKYRRGLSSYLQFRGNIVVPPVSFEDVFTARNESIYL